MKIFLTLLCFLSLVISGCHTPGDAEEIPPSLMPSPGTSQSSLQSSPQTPSPSPLPVLSESQKNTYNNYKREIESKSTIENFWKKAYEMVYAGESGKGHTVSLHRSALVHGDYGSREIALTFDDGPHRKYTPQLLRILKHYRVKATFFIVGKMAVKNEDLVRAQRRDGHVIGNHSYHHVDLTRISDKDAEVEWLACNQVVKDIVGCSPKYCRPPGGNYDESVLRAAVRHGLLTVLWTDDPGDYAEPGRDVLINRLLCAAYNGGIILLHDGIQQTINILPSIIEHLKKEGYKFITIDEMCRQRRCEIQ